MTNYTWKCSFDSISCINFRGILFECKMWVLLSSRPEADSFSVVFEVQFHSAKIA